MIEKIMNYFEYDDKLSAGGQPSTEQIKALKENGVEVVISLSPTSTRNYLPEEAQIVEKLNMQFIHFPIDCSNLKTEHYDAFKGILDGVNRKKAFVHCGGNIKSSNLIHMYKVMEQDVDEKESAQQLKKIQNPESKWIEYFQSFGMIGLS